MRRFPLLAVVLVALPALMLPGNRIEQAVAAPAAKEKVSPEVKKLMEQRVELLKRGLKGSLNRREQDPAHAPGLEAILKIARQLRKAELSLATKPAERIAAHLSHFKFICEMDTSTVNAYEGGGVVAHYDVLLMRATRLGAEIDLRQAGGTPPKDIKPAREIKDPRKRKQRDD